MFHDVSCTILWRCKLKSPQNGWELKKEYNPFISKHNTHDLHDLYFSKGVLNTNKHSKCEGQKQFLYD